MWERSILKSNAKVALTGRYWLAFATCLVAGAIMKLCDTGLSIRSTFQNIDNFFQTNLIGEYAGVFGGLFLVSVLLSTFISSVITIGQNRFFVHNHFGDSRFETLFSGFTAGYINCVGAVFVTDLFILLWTLLLIVPGIIKGYQYYFVSYILSDNPNMPGSRAREISRMLTNGEKANIFVLGLSFIGWYILGVICFGVGILFVNPYYEATNAELYIFLRDRAIQSGMLNPAELCLVAPANVEQPFVPPVYPQTPIM